MFDPTKYDLFSATGAAAASTSATQSATANYRIVVYHASYSSSAPSASALISIESPTGTVLWQKYVPAGSSLTSSENFNPGLRAPSNTDISLIIGTGSTKSAANLFTYRIPG